MKIVKQIVLPYKGLVNEGSVKFAAGLEPEKQNRDEKGFLNAGRAERKRPLILSIVMRKSGAIHLLQEEWRRDRDSNPRNRKRFNRFRVCRLRPLGHLSIILIPVFS